MIKWKKKLERFSDHLTTSNLLLFQLVLTIFALIQTWVMQYQNLSGSANLIGRVSFQVFDPPYMPSGRNAAPILYEHVFGDWYMAMDYVHLANPYLITNSPSQTPPLGNLFLFILSPLGQKYGFALFLCFALISWIWIFKKVLAKQSALIIFLSTSLYFILTLPTIISFDRGSLHILAFGLIGISWIKYTEGKFAVASIPFILAVSMKPQLSLVLIVLLLNKDFVRLAKVVLGTLGVNLFLLLFYDGGFFASFKGYLNATLFFASPKAGGYMLDSASMTGFVLRRIENRNGGPYVTEWINTNGQTLSLIGAGILLLVLPVLFSNVISQRVKFFLILSLTSLVAPVSMAYTMIWCSLAIIPFLTNDFNFQSKSKMRKNGKGKHIKKQILAKTKIDSWKLSDYLALLCIALVITPTFWLHWTGARNISFPRDRYPYAVLLVIAVSYIEVLVASRFNFIRKFIKERQ